MFWSLKKLENPFCFIMVLTLQLHFYLYCHLVFLSFFFGRNCGGRQDFLNPTLHYISRLSMSHHLPCKAGTVTELADHTAISGGPLLSSAKPGFPLHSHINGRLEKPPQGRSIQGRWNVWMAESNSLCLEFLFCITVTLCTRDREHRRPQLPSVP